MTYVDVSAYDIYIFQSNGLPILAGCSGSDYCKSHYDQHELHSGFIAALNSFSKEVFTDTPRTILYKDIQINMKIENELTIMTVHPVEIQNDLIQIQLNDIFSKFKEKYGVEFEHFIDVDIFEDFQSEVDKMGLINTQMVNIKSMQKIDINSKPSLKDEKKKSFFNFLRRKKK